MPGESARLNNVKEKAIAFATYRAMLYLFPEDEEWIAAQVRKEGFNPKDDSVDVSTPQGAAELPRSAGSEEGAQGVAAQPGSREFRKTNRRTLRLRCWPMRRNSS